MQLKGSKTHGNLKAAFAGESQANRRYLYFAAKADVEGQNDVAAVFRSTAEGETGHEHRDCDQLGLHCLPPLGHSISSTYHHAGTVRNESGIPIPTMSVVSGGSSLCSVATIAAPIIGAMAASKNMIRV